MHVVLIPKLGIRIAGGIYFITHPQVLTLASDLVGLKVDLCIWRVSTLALVILSGAGEQMTENTSTLIEVFLTF